MGIFTVSRSIHGFSPYFLGWKILSLHRKKESRRYKELCARKFDSDFSFADKVKIITERFKARTGYTLNLERPRTFNEKMQWLKLYHHDPLMTVCADKYRVKNYLLDVIGPEYLIPTLQSWDDPDKIDFSTLRGEFVLKVNWGSGQNVIVRDKSTADTAEIRTKLKEWMSPDSNRYFHSFESSYKDIEPRILCEPYIGDLSQNLTCYKVFTFSGEPYLIQAVFDDKTRDETINYYDLDWNLLPFRQNYPNNPDDVPKPVALGTILALAEKLAQPFQYFARVDFYEVNGKVIFSEFTFFSDNGMAAFTPQCWDEKLGDMIHLPVDAITH